MPKRGVIMAFAVRLNKKGKKKSMKGKSDRQRREARWVRAASRSGSAGKAYSKWRKRSARKARLSVGTRRKNSSAARRKATAGLRGRMFVRMRKDAAGYRGMGFGYNKAYDDAVKSIAGKVVEVDTTHLFDDQYNLKDYPIRVFDKQIVEVINDVRRGKTKSGWSGVMKPTRGPRSGWDEPAAHVYARESKFDVQKLYKPLRVHPGRRAAAHGRWHSGGTVKQVFKNGNVLLTNGKRIAGVARSMRYATPKAGQKLYVDPEGRTYFVFKVQSYDGPTVPYVYVVGHGEIVTPRDYQAEEIYGKRFASLSLTEIAHKARHYLNSQGR